MAGEQQLGKTGKEGTVYLVKIDGIEYAKKTFKKRKSMKRVQREAEYQQMAFEVGVAPEVIEVGDTPTPFITMDKMDETIIQYAKENDNILTEEKQIQLLSLFQRLDDIGLFHNDSNPLNIMTIGNEFKLIDYGFSKKISRKDIKKWGKKVNIWIGLRRLLQRFEYRELFKNKLTILIDAVDKAKM